METNETNNTPESAAAEQQKNPDASLVSFVITAVVALFIVWVCMGGGGESEPGAAGELTPSEERRILREAQTAVRNVMRSPSTAQFPRTILDAEQYDWRTDGAHVFRISSWVDAQNAFGATVRQNWTVQLRRRGAEFKVEYVEVAGRVFVDDR